APDLGQELVQKLLFSLLGPGSSGVQINGQALHTFLGLPGLIPGLGLLVDYETGNALPGVINESVVDGAIVATESGGDDFLWKYRLRDEFNPPVDINFDLGWDALGLAMDVGLDVTLAWDLALGLGISRTNGAYIFIGDHRQTG